MKTQEKEKKTAYNITKLTVFEFTDSEYLLKKNKGRLWSRLLWSEDPYDVYAPFISSMWKREAGASDITEVFMKAGLIRYRRLS